jgi:hypothetical protein
MNLTELKPQLEELMEQYAATKKTSAQDFAAGSVFQVKTEQVLSRLRDIADVLRSSVSRIDGMCQSLQKSKDNPALRYEVIDKALSIAKDRDLYQCLLDGLGTFQKEEGQ